MTKNEMKIGGKIWEIDYDIDKKSHIPYIAIRVLSEDSVMESSFKIEYYFSDNQKDNSYEELSNLIDSFILVEANRSILGKITTINDVINEEINGSSEPDSPFEVNIIITEEDGIRSYKLEPYY